MLTSEPWKGAYMFDKLAKPYEAEDNVGQNDTNKLEIIRTPESTGVLGIEKITIVSTVDPQGRRNILDFRARLADIHSLSKELFCGAELEFVLFPENDARLVDGQAYSLSSIGSLQKCLEDILETLDAYGIQWVDLHQENAPHQYEISLAHCEFRLQADRIFLARFLIRMTARKHGCIASFVSVPFSDQSVVSHMHLTFSDHSRSLAPRFTRFASELCGDGFLALFPTVNSRKSQNMTSFAAKCFDPAARGRFATIRERPDSSVEFRSVSSDANPYLVLLLIGELFDQDLPNPAKREFYWDFADSIEAFKNSSFIQDAIGQLGCDLYTEMKIAELAESAGKTDEDLHAVM